MIFSERCLGHEITVRAVRLDDGTAVLITGGCRTHVGSSSMCEPGQAPSTLLSAGHRDDVVSEMFAKRLADELGIKASVSCGIHYDNASADDIQMILSVCRLLLDRLVRSLS